MKLITYINQCRINGCTRDQLICILQHIKDGTYSWREVDGLIHHVAFNTKPYSFSKERSSWDIGWFIDNQEKIWYACYADYHWQNNYNRIPDYTKSLDAVLTLYPKEKPTSIKTNIYKALLDFFVGELTFEI